MIVPGEKMAIDPPGPLTQNGWPTIGTGTGKSRNPAVKWSNNYTETRDVVSRSRDAQDAATTAPGPRRQVLACGVERAATLHSSRQATATVAPLEATRPVESRLINYFRPVMHAAYNQFRPSSEACTTGSHSRNRRAGWETSLRSGH